MLEVSALNYRFVDNPLFTNINFSLIPGQTLYLQGANGTGKTTLMRVIAGLVPYDQGYIRWDGRLVKRPSDYRGKLCYLGHKSGCFMQLSLRENLIWHYRLMLGQKLVKQKSAKDEINSKIKQALDFAGLGLHQHSDFYLLSAGQQQRFHLAKLYLSLQDNLHTIWLLDEPLANLDKLAKTLFFDLYKMFTQRQGIVILASHQDQEGIYADQHIRLSS